MAGKSTAADSAQDSAQESATGGSGQDEPAAATSGSGSTLWSDLSIDPVEIALPTGVGYTLRAYRQSTQITFSEIDRDEDDYSMLDRPAVATDPELAEPEIDEAELTAEALAAGEDDEVTKKEVAKNRAKDKLDPEEAEIPAETPDDDLEDADAQDDSADDLDTDADDDPDVEDVEDETDAEADDDSKLDEEIPVFLGTGGRLLLFRTTKGLVEFIRSDAAHELTQVANWSRLKAEISEDDLTPAEDDRYELDLVVKNLRGGHDAWDADLLIRAGEVARDLGYALRLEPVLTALSAGSPLDDLDEALRGDAKGGIGGFFARRKIRKIGAQQAAIGWRAVIGKISAVVDWRD